MAYCIGFRLILIHLNFMMSVLGVFEIKLGVLIPEGGNYDYAKSKVLPAIYTAVRSDDVHNLLPDFNLTINYRDSKCSDTYGPLSAVDLYYKKEANIYFGPVCSFAVAPAARFGGVWDIPLITPGAPVQAFGDKTGEFRLLTRMQASYQHTANAMEALLVGTFNWSTVGIIYHDHLHTGQSDEFFLLKPFFDLMKKYKMPWYKSFDENKPDTFDFGEILQEAENNTRGKVLNLGI